MGQGQEKDISINVANLKHILEVQDITIIYFRLFCYKIFK